MSKYDLVLHVDKTDGSLSIAMSNAINYAKALIKEPYEMVLVVNSRAVTQMTKGSAIVSDLEKACAAGLAVRVCRNALEATGTKEEDLLPQCVVVPAGLVEIVDLQRRGYAYVKP